MRLLQKIKLGRGQVSLYLVGKIFFEKIQKDAILERANSVAFSFTIAIFPAIIFLFALIPYIHKYIPEVDNAFIMEFIGANMPSSMFEVIEGTVFDIIDKQRSGLLNIGFFLSIFLASNGTMSLMNAFDSRYKTLTTRSFLKSRLIATALTFILAFLLVLSMVLLVAGEVVLDFIDKQDVVIIDDYIIYLALIVRFVVLFLAFLFSVCSLYYFGPAVHQKWGFFSSGATIATIFTLAASYGFSLYITNWGTYNKLYGSIGVMIALMVWIMLLANILLIGYEINASLHKALQLARESKHKSVSVV